MESRPIAFDQKCPRFPNTIEEESHGSTVFPVRMEERLSVHTELADQALSFGRGQEVLEPSCVLVSSVGVTLRVYPNRTVRVSQRGISLHQNGEIGAIRECQPGAPVDEYVRLFLRGDQKGTTHALTDRRVPRFGLWIEPRLGPEALLADVSARIVTA